MDRKDHPAEQDAANAQSIKTGAGVALLLQLDLTESLLTKGLHLHIIATEMTVCVHIIEYLGFKRMTIGGNNA
jgi:hypothetical protein